MVIIGGYVYVGSGGGTPEPYLLDMATYSTSSNPGAPCLLGREFTVLSGARCYGVLMTIDNHYACPALRFYLGFEKWIWPIVFGLILIGILGGVAAFERFGLTVPAP